MLTILFTLFLVLSGCGNKSSNGNQPSNNQEPSNNNNNTDIHTHTVEHIHKDPNCFSNGFDGDYCSVCKEQLSTIETSEASHVLDDKNVCRICGTKVFYTKDITEKTDLGQLEKYEFVFDDDAKSRDGLKIPSSAKLVVIHCINDKKANRYFTFNSEVQVVLNNVHCSGALFTSEYPTYIYTTGQSIIYVYPGSRGYSGTPASPNGGDGYEASPAINCPEAYLYVGANSSIRIHGGDGGSGGGGSQALYGGGGGDGGDGANGCNAFSGNLYINQENDKATLLQYFGMGGKYEISAGIGGYGGAGYYASGDGKNGQNGEVGTNIHELEISGGNIYDLSNPGTYVPQPVPPVEECKHEEVLIVESAYDPTCLYDGRTEEVRCKKCNALVKAPVSIPALGHLFEHEDDTECSRCHMKFYTDLNELKADDSASYNVNEKEVYINAQYPRLGINLNSTYENMTIDLSIPNVNFIQFYGGGKTLQNVRFNLCNRNGAINVFFKDVRIELKDGNSKSMFTSDSAIYLYSLGVNRFTSSNGADGVDGASSNLGDGANGTNGKDAASIFDFKETHLYCTDTTDFVDDVSHFYAKAGNGGKGGNGGMSSGVLFKDGNGGDGGKGGYIFTGSLYINEEKTDRFARTYGLGGIYNLQAGLGGEGGKKPSGSLSDNGHDGAKGYNGLVASNIIQTSLTNSN